MGSGVMGGWGVIGGGRGGEMGGVGRMNNLGELLVYGESWFTCSHCQKFSVSSKVKI